jgi:hypothetical protein
MGGRRKAGHRADGYARLSSKVCGEANPATLRLSCDGEGIFPKCLCLHCQEKPLASLKVPVPQTDTGRRGENPKTLGRTLVKELGKMTP